MSKKRARGPRRSHLRRFSASVVNSGKGTILNQNVSAEYNARTRTLGDAFVDRDPRHTYVSEDQRLESIWRSEFHQGMEKFNRIVIEKGKYTQLSLHFHGSRWKFVRRNAAEMLISIEYSSRERALRAHELGRVVWVQSHSIPAPTPPPG